MNAPPYLSAPGLDHSGVRHGFFSRAGGVSEGVYASLNTGPGSGDDPAAVSENRRRCAAAIGVEADALLTNYQVHSRDVVHADGPWADAPPKADALVTKTPKLALGVLAADCMPWLFVEPEARIIGAAHAGWRGALAGVLENTVAAMENLGANRTLIHAAVGPCMRQQNFEVGLELIDAFEKRHAGAEKFFAPGVSPDKRQLDLVGFGKWRLGAVGVEAIDDVEVCTLGESAHYFSYRASKRASAPDYGRNLSAIALL